LKSNTTKESITGIILAGGSSSRFGFNKLKIKVNSVPLFIDQILKLCFFCDEIIISTSTKNYSFISYELDKINSYIQSYNFKKIQASNPKINFKDFFIRTTPPLNVKIVSDEDTYKKFSKKSSFNAGDSGKSKSCRSKIGPILGIYSGLTNATHFYSMVIASDMPFISYNILNLLSGITGQAYKKSDSNKTAPSPAPEQVYGKTAYTFKTGKGLETLCSLYSKDTLHVLGKKIKEKKYRVSDVLISANTGILNGEKNGSAGIDSLNFFNINHKMDYDRFKNIWKSKKALLNINTTSAGVWSDFFFR
jgi:molybdopterin-guanine dinucleotide biosynthesis protein A